MPKTVPCLWFDGQAAQAAAFYTGVFPRSEVTSVSHYPPDAPGGEGPVLTVEFTLDGQPYVGLNAGPQHPFTDAISFQVPCGDQDEVDHYWDALGAGGEHGPCGWLKDRFGVSWQVFPTRLGELLSDPDPGRAERAMQAMMTMSRLDLAALERAADG